MLPAKMRGPDDRRRVVDVRDDVLDLLGGVTELHECPRDRLVHDRHRSATDELLGLDQSEIGFDAGGVAVHEQTDRPGRGEHARLRVANSVTLPELDCFVPCGLRGGEQFGRDRLLVDVCCLGSVHLEHPEHRL